MARSTRTLLLGAAVLLAAALTIALAGDEQRETGDPAATSPTPTEAIATSTTSTTSTTSSTTTSTTTTTLDPRFVESVEQSRDLVDRATAEELAYRLVVTGLTGEDLAGRLTGMVGSVCVGGIFLTESNGNWSPTDDPAAYAAAREALTRQAFDDSGCGVDPLFTTDAELGSVVRVPVESPAAAPTWTQRYIEGEPSNVLLDLQEQVAAYATELRGLGIDINFGTVGDVSTAPDHFMARQGRTFGDDPGIVAALSGAVVRAHCEAGVAPTLKHFPNQGATIEDPHRERSTAVGGAEAWATTGRLAYEATESPVVMVGHIFMDDIDRQRPASLSPAVIGELLRGELGYDGLVITDDMSTMRGASDVIADPGDRAVAAISAGADMVLFVDDRDIPRVVDALVAEIETDADFRLQALAAFRRVLRVHQGLQEPDLFPLCG